MDAHCLKSGSFAARWILFIVLAALLAFDFWLVLTGQSQEADDAILGIFYAMRGDALTSVFRTITFCGNIVPMLVLCSVLILLPGRLQIGIPVVLMTAGGAFGQQFLKLVIARPRPDMTNWLVDEPSFSFPSGHACTSMIFWVALLILVGRGLVLQKRRRAALLLQIVFALFSVSVGISRLYLGVHYPTDIAGGWLLAGMMLIAFFTIYENYWPAKWRISI